MSNLMLDEFGFAIGRNSNSLENMRNEIWAILFHKISTDENPQYESCSECRYERSKVQATGSLDQANLRRFGPLRTAELLLGRL